MKKTDNSKYSVASNVGFMLKRSWRQHKSVIFLCLALVTAELLINLAELFIAPAVLQKVEVKAPLGELIFTIAFFSLSLIILRGIKGYIEQNTLFGRVHIRAAIMNDVVEKNMLTSYPNTQSIEKSKKCIAALQPCWGNSEATEHIWETLTELLINMGGFVIYAALMSELNFYLLLVIVVTTAIGFLCSKRLESWGYRHREEAEERSSKHKYVQNMMQSSAMAKDIRVFGLVPWLRELREKTESAVFAIYAKREKYSAAAGIIDVLLTFLRNGIAYVYLINAALKENMPASEFLLYFAAFSGFSAWVTGIMEKFKTLYRESLDISKVREYLDMEEDFLFEKGEKLPDIKSCELELKNVSFRYPESDTYIIENMNLKIKAGEKLAIVGLNGAGKTTLIKILCGLYDPTEGQVLLNGRDIRKYNRREYYGLFSAVFQDFCMPDLTVSETVAQDFENINTDKVKDCVEKAGLTKQIEAFPKKYDTHLGKEVFLDGVELSGGQTQRLMLARALYKDGAVLVLDEPTSALDPLAESDIYNKYNEMTAGKTSVFISHRLASTRFCDRILFLQNGKVTEEGTHRELLEKGGGYAELFEVQARYYQEGREFQ